MNYRHAFHAGNFADLIKHAVLTAAMRTLTSAPGPLTVLDTHAGAGLYDLEGGPASRTGEATQGVLKLVTEASPPPVFDALRAAIERVNSGGKARFYPGSPLLVAGFLRPGDRLIACELRADDAASLRGALVGRPGPEVVAGDGWKIAHRRCPPPQARALVLIDPPYESAADLLAAAAAMRGVIRRNTSATVVVWAPIKDLTGYDALLSGLEDAAGAAPLLAIESRLRSLSDPTRLNGCALIVANPTDGLAETALEAARWIIGAFGEDGGEARV